MEQDLALFVRLLRIDAEVFVVEMVNSDITPHTVSRAREFEESRAAAYGTPLASPSQTSLRRMNTATKMNAVLTERYVSQITFLYQACQFDHCVLHGFQIEGCRPRRLVPSGSA